MGSKLLCLWLSFGRRKVMGAGSFYEFLKQVVAFAPLASGFSESGESLQVTWKASEEDRSLGLKGVDSTICAWVLQLLVWAQPLLA